VLDHVTTKYVCLTVLKKSTQRAWSRLVLSAFLLVLAAAAPSYGQTIAPASPTTTPTTAPATQPAATRAYTLPEISGQVEATVADLEAIQRLLEARARLDAIEMELPVLVEDIAARQAESSRVMSPSASVELLRDLEHEWEAIRLQISSWQADLTDRVDELSAIQQRLSAMQKNWALTLEMLTQASAEPAVIDRLRPLNDDITRLKTLLTQQQSAAGSMLNQVNIQNVRATEVLVTVRQAQSRAIDRLTSRDSLGIWKVLSPSTWASSETDRTQASSDSFTKQWDAVAAYVRRVPGAMLIHILIVAALAALLIWMRPHVRQELANDAQGVQAAIVFQHPLLTAYILAIFVAPKIYTSPPRMFWTVLGGVGLVALGILLRRMVEGVARPVLYAAIALCFMRLLQSMSASHPSLLRWLYLLEMGGLAGFCVLYLWRQPRLTFAQIRDLQERGMDRSGERWLAFALVVTGFLALVSLGANIFGYVALAKLLAGGLVMIAYMAMLLYAGIHAADALTLGAMSVRPLIMLRMVRRESATIRRWLNRLFVLGALWFGLYYTLEAFAIRRALFTAVYTVLWAEWRSGPVRLSLGYVMLLVLTIAAAFTLSRLIRFLLEEDIYPHLSLGRGIPYAVSTLLHYVILLVGFLAAISTVYDLSQFTILASAFGIGLGFGLQNIVSNFVSGLILLFERPVQVGDVIEVSGTPATVTRIGIRASVVRTTNAAEIIIPNGQLIADKVTNWTLSNRQRGLEVTVSTARTTDSQTVIALLLSVARATPGVADSPTPTVVVVAMNAATFTYQLNAWTSLEDWNLTRSSLLQAVSGAFEKQGLTLS
jgi:potassium-dependent mechanosensitive channel